MGALSRIREAWTRELQRWRASSAPRRKLAASPISEFSTRTEILDFDSLREYRLAHREVQSQIRGQVRARVTTPEELPLISPSAMNARGFLRNPVVRTCFNIITGNVDLVRTAVVDSEGREARGPAADRIRRFLEFPTGVREGVRGGIGPALWKKSLAKYLLDLLNGGNGMWEMVMASESPTPGPLTSDPVELRLMPVGKTLVQPLPESGATFGAIEYYVVTLDGMPFKVPPERVLHMGFWQPESDFLGIPPLFSALQPLALDNELMNFSNTTMKNLGVPPYILEYDLEELEKGGMALDPYHVPKDLASMIELRDKFTGLQGGENRGKPLMAFGFKVKLLGMDMSKLDVAGLITMSESRIYSVHGVPLILAGRSAMESDPTRANFKESRLHFLQSTISSLLARIADEIGPRIVSAFGPAARGLRIKFDLSGIDVIRDQRLTRNMQAGAVFNSGLYPRGTCQAMAGEPLEGTSEQLEEFVPLREARAPSVAQDEDSA